MIHHEFLVDQFIQSGSLSALLEWMAYLRSHALYYISVLVGELTYSYFSYDTQFLDELGQAYYYCGLHEQSWNVYKELLSFSHLNEQQQKAYFFNAHFNIPYLLTLRPAYDKEIVNNIQHTYKQSVPLITFSITTCKRYDLFERTMNSFLRYCTDIELISRWICIDDNSSNRDRTQMKIHYPFFEFVWKEEIEKGHAKSMNMILDRVDTPYLFHMEDDWEFFTEQPYMRQCMDVLNHDASLGQCLINKNYAETFEDIRIIGGIYKTTSSGTRYYEHVHEPDIESFYALFGHGPNCAYWAHYSLRPSMVRVSTLRDVGTYNVNADHFEMEYAHRYTSKGYRSAFLDTISCQHIGRLTSERDDPTKENAYILNQQSQFTSSHSSHQPLLEMIIINLKSRPDRWNTMMERLPQTEMPFIRFDAVNGYTLRANRYLEQLFNDNDYRYRKGMIGCALSHIALWIHTMNKNEPKIILEDDVEFVHDFSAKAQTLLSQVNEWDILFLGHHLYPHLQTEDTYHTYKLPTIERWSVERSLTQSRGGTGGYIISPNGAKKMLLFIQEHGMTNGIDTMMQKACDTLSIYYTTPHLIYSECCDDNTNIDTDIQYNHDSLQRPKYKRFSDEFTFLLGIDADIPFLKTCNKKHPEDTIVYCDKGCETNDVRYKIEDINVCIPDTLFFKYPELQNIGLVFNNTFSVKHLITRKIE